MLALAAGCAPAGSRDASSTDTAGTMSTSDSTATQQDTAATTQATATNEEKKPMNYENQVAVLHTTAGDISIRFFPDIAPNHVKNFLDLASSGFYNGTKFHRVIPGFMIQGGDPNTKTDNVGSWGMGGSEKNVNAEFSRVPHKRGIVSMARSQSPNSASSQFFIVVGDSNFLDNKYTVFGQVTQGMDIADKIVGAPTNGERPVNPVAITGIDIRSANADEQGPAPK
jgi:cyclophilin family peptidyl-prolyl cis-trans isomerase